MAAVVMLCGCAENPETQDNDEKSQWEKYENISFIGTKFDIPEISTASVLTLTPLKGKPVRELYDFLAGAVDELLPGEYSDSEKAYEIRFVDGVEVDDNASYPYNCPKLEQYLETMQSAYPWLTISTKENYIEMKNGCLRGFDNGALIRYDKSDFVPILYFKYYFSKFFSAVICGGLSTMLGVAVFGIFCALIFPSAGEQMYPNGAAVLIFKQIISAFLCGFSAALPAFFLCSFCGNAHVILCVPFLLKFITETVLMQVSSNSGDFSMYERLAPFYPMAISSVFEYERKTLITTVIVNLLYCAAAFVGFSLIMEKRADKGA